MTDSIRVLIADDHTIVRSGVRLLLEAEPDIEVVGEAVSGEHAVALAEELQPDTILMDIGMPGMDGMEATRRVKEENPNINVLVLTVHRSDEYFFEMLKAGASGYILKGADIDDLVNAIRSVSRGEVFLYPSMAKKLLQEYLERSKEARDDVLSTREREVLGLLAEGYSNKEIAERLFISLSTVHTHRSNLMNKLGLSSRRELIQYAHKKGIT